MAFFVDTTNIHFKSMSFLSLKNKMNKFDKQNQYMSNKFFTSLLIFTSTVVFAQTQLQMNDSTKKEFERSDKELNRVYQQILTDYNSDTLFLKNLRTSQKIWIQFRDAEMKMKYPLKENEYYSMQPVCWLAYMQGLTETRTTTLKQWLQPLEDGDVCAGSILPR